jgi:hypothetical protein
VTTEPESPTSSRTGPLATGPNVRPGETPPEYPALARQHTPDGALAFAVYYFKAFDWGYATNDSSLVAAISAPRCDACASYVKGLRSLRKRQEDLLGGRITLRSSSVAPNTYRIEAEYVVDVAVDEQPVVLHGPTATHTVSPAARNDHSLVFVAWRRTAWEVVEVTAK